MIEWFPIHHIYASLSHFSSPFFNQHKFQSFSWYHLKSFSLYKTASKVWSKILGRIILSHFFNSATFFEKGASTNTIKLTRSQSNLFKAESLISKANMFYMYTIIVDTVKHCDAKVTQENWKTKDLLPNWAKKLKNC